MLDADSIGSVLDVLRPEREALLVTLSGMDARSLALPTECPAYSVKGIAMHVLGDDLSLLSRQRDEAENGLLQMASDMPGADFRALLDAFNDRWVGAARFLSMELVTELLRLTGEWTASYYERVDPGSPGEPVGFFGVHGSSSPFWHAIAREYMERWVHHSQIRRSIGRGSLADRLYLSVGTEIAATIAGVEAGIPEDPDGSWTLGPLVLGQAQQAADILTRGHCEAEIRSLVAGPSEAVSRLAGFAGRT